jgi:hypothetical protein
MICYRYPAGAMARDYLLSGAGLVLFLSPLALMDLPGPAKLVFSSLGGLFVVFVLQVYRRHRTRIALSDKGLKVAPWGRELAWSALTKLVLRYFALRRDGERGWMELKLVSGGQSIRVDSRLEGFSEIVSSAARAAGDNGLELDPATLTNLAALGVDAPQTAEVDERAQR